MERRYKENITTREKEGGQHSERQNEYIEKERYGGEREICKMNERKSKRKT